MLQKFRENRKLQGTLLISPTLLWMIALLIIPLILSVITSFGGRDADGNVIYTFSLNNYLRLIGYSADTPCDDTPPPCFNDLYIGILWRSLTLAFQTTLLVILLAYPLAYFVARASPKRRNTFLFLILVPLWTNFVIRIYAWIMILRTQGVLNSVIGWAIGLFGGEYAPLDFYPSSGAVLVGMVYEFLPFMILPIYTSLEKIDGSLYEAAADLGANALRTLWRVTLPLSMPGVVAGTILVFIPVMGTFVVSDILGGRQVILVGNLIQRQFLDARDPAFGSAASIVLMALTLVVTIFYTRKFGFGEEIASA
ncbi:MAG TPA: ABC transporter permease [Anaerolineales bacterium]|nr:ABC transporter permease [Anaerolineales bacterium]